MKANIKISVSTVLLLLATLANSQDSAMQKAEETARAEKTSLLMRDKLNASKSLLEGMTTENFELVRLSLADLKRISAETVWQNTGSASFQGYATSFQNAVDDMTKDVEEEPSVKNVALPFIRINLSCLECHEFVRRPLKKARRGR